MFDPSNFFNLVFVIPILNILIAIYKFLEVLKIPGALGFSLIILTVIIRLLLTPLTITQIRNTYKLNKLKPKLDKLASRFKKDKQKLHQEQLKLYQKEGINPAGGCLPVLVQMPIIIALYNLFFRLLTNNNISSVIPEMNKVVYFSFLKISSLELSFFGINLAYKPNNWQKYGWWLVLIPVVTAVLQYWQAKTMTSQVQTKKTEEEKKQKEEDMGTIMQKQMSIMMPLMIGFFAYNFPIGLSLYWNTFTVFGIIQQRKLNKHFDKIGKK